MTPSFHRDYLFGQLDPSTNANFQQPVLSTDPNYAKFVGAQRAKYLTLRPIPAQHPRFPLPVDKGGDVKNLDGAPGGCDSIWIDINAPIRTAPDGRRYKMMVAPLIIELDGRLDLNAIGNLMGGTHSSNQGWGTWEINPAKVLSSGTEWPNIFQGSQATGLARIRGRYDLDATRGPAGYPLLPKGNNLRAWAQVDFDGVGGGSDPLTMPAPGTASGYFGFPSFPATRFGNGGTENTNHASIYSALFPRGTNRRIPIQSLAQLLRFGGTGSDMLTSELTRLLPTNLVSGTNATKTRQLLTLLSADLDRPGATPYIWDRLDATTRYKLLGDGSAGNPFTLRNNPAIPFPAINPVTAPPAGSEFDATTLRYALNLLKRIDLSRPLRPYPAADPTTGLMPAAGVLTANQDRQGLAREIFDTLITVTGAVPPSASFGAPFGKDSPEFRACRALAQLAVNIVDYIDSDDISTPFMWFTEDTNGNGVLDTGEDLNGNTKIDQEWVFGVELPRLVINETYVSRDDNPAALEADGAGGMRVMAGGTQNINTWVELMNPLPDTDLSGIGDNTATLQYGTRAVYRVLLADPNLNTATVLKEPANVTGDPDYGITPTPAPETPASKIRTVMNNWGANAALYKVTPLPAANRFKSAVSGSVGFYGLGPNTTGLFSDPAQDDPKIPITLASPKMSYTTPYGATHRPTIVLQRLANPGLSFDPNQTVSTTDPMSGAVSVTPNPGYNPFITTDFVDNTDPTKNYVMEGRRFDLAGPVAAGTAPVAVTARQSWGRSQPYAGDNSQRVIANPNNPPAGQAKNTFFRQNSQIDQANNGATPPAGPGLDFSTTDPMLKIPFDWLVHLDRQPITPFELWHVSRTTAHDLTQFFVQGTVANQHAAPWDDQSARLYRFFEFVTIPPRGSREDQRIVVNNPAVAFTLTFNGATTNSLPGNATSAQVATELNNLTSISGTTPASSVSVIQTGNVYGVTFLGGLSTSMQPLMVASPLSTATPPGPSIFYGTLPGAGGRVAGRVNINGIWTPEMLQALADAQGGNLFGNNEIVDPASPPTGKVITTGIFQAVTDSSVTPAKIIPTGVFARLMATRSPGAPYQPTTNTYTPVLRPTDAMILQLAGMTGTPDRPIWSMAMGYAASSATAAFQPGVPRGTENTLLRTFNEDMNGNGTLDTTPPLSEDANNNGVLDTNLPVFDVLTNNKIPVTHPYQKKELLTKLFGNVTTRSNVFAVWLTVGFFEVYDEGDANANGKDDDAGCNNNGIFETLIGEEMGKSENRHVRHRMFAIVDRSHMQVWPTYDPDLPNTPTVRSGVAITMPGGSLPGIPFDGAVTLADSSGAATTSVVNKFTKTTWTLKAGAVLVYEPNTDREETVVVRVSGGSFVASFTRDHPLGCIVVSRGNPGPWSRYDPRQDSDVVPYYAIID